jgi:hypothetical protein
MSNKTNHQHLASVELVLGRLGHLARHGLSDGQLRSLNAEVSELYERFVNRNERCETESTTSARLRNILE